jgi:hypothetical protein
MEVIEIPDDDVISIDSNSDQEESNSSGIEDVSDQQYPRDNYNVPRSHDYEKLRPDDENDWLSQYSNFDIDAQNDPWEFNIPPSPHQTTTPVLPRYAPSIVDRRPWTFMDDRNGHPNNKPVAQESTFEFGEGRFDGPADQPSGTSNSQVNFKVECVNDVVAIFPDICRDFVSELYDTEVGATAEPLIAHILDKMDRGIEYPKAKDKIRPLKRKREVDEDEEAAKEYGRADRESSGIGYAHIAFVTETFS